MQTTLNYNLPLLQQNQAMKEIVHNDAITRIDNLLSISIIDFIDILPELSFEGDMYIMLNDKQKNMIALFYNKNFSFIKPKRGMYFLLQKERKFVFYNGTEWEILA